jgi:hypothetical protein
MSFRFNNCACHFVCLFGFILACGLTSIAQAAMVSFSATTSVPLTATDWTDQPISFPKFDPSLGELTKVQLDFSGSISSSKGIAHSLDTPIGIDGFTKSIFSIRGIGNTLIDRSFEIDTDYFHFDLAPLSGIITPETIDSWGGPPQGVVFSDDPSLVLFSGTGDIHLRASASASLWTSAQNNQYDQYIQSYLIMAQESLTGSVTYYFNAVPEPSILHLMLCALMGIWVFRLINR